MKQAMKNSPIKIVSIALVSLGNPIGFEYFLSRQIDLACRCFFDAGRYVHHSGVRNSTEVELVFHFLYPCVTAAGFGCDCAAECADGDWSAWAYAWLLLTAGLGVGLALANRQNPGTHCSSRLAGDSHLAALHSSHYLAPLRAAFLFKSWRPSC
jgi:hypothetical protein